jgi:DNA polymerase III delta prime subunit
MKPLLNLVTDTKLSRIMGNLPQSLLLTGPVGVGTSVVATYIGATVGDVTFTVLPEKDDKIDIDKGVISVDSIRRLYIQTRSIQTGKLVIIIDYAERMGHQAQNAFLKLLEEPGSGVHFILVTHTPSKLLPTVVSRTQQLEIQPVTPAQSLELLETLFITNEQKKAQLLFMADGLPAELTRLATDDDYFETSASIVRDARDLLQADVYQKILIAQRYKDDREKALRLVTTTSNLLRKSISKKPQSSSIAQIDSLLYAYKQINANGNIRLCLARLVV